MINKIKVAVYFETASLIVEHKFYLSAHWTLFKPYYILKEKSHIIFSN